MHGGTQLSAKFREGDWFTVPLSNGKWAIGRIARRNRSVLLGYFFGPSREHVPTLSDLAELRPDDAIYIARFGYLGLRDGKWPILGGHGHWNKADWPMPAFARQEPSGRRCWRVEYDDCDPLNMIGETPITIDEYAKLPKDGLDGAEFVEQRLSSLLNAG